jgi:hypothetical protein
MFSLLALISLKKSWNTLIEACKPLQTANQTEQQYAHTTVADLLCLSCLLMGLFICSLPILAQVMIVQW